MRFIAVLFFLLSIVTPFQTFADENQYNNQIEPTATSEESESPTVSPSPTPEETEIPSEKPTASPPQAVLITMDDMRPDDMRYMPKFIKFIKENHGLDLPRAFVSCPLCCPSRASLMTGLYASNHGVIGNSYPLLKKTIFETFKEADPNIKTGLIGKYLNSFHGGYKPEFDEWVSYKGGMIYNWFSMNLNINGKQTTVKEYVSDFFLRRADEFVDKYIDDPYLLYLHFTAPHFPSSTPSNFAFDCSQVKMPKYFNVIDQSAPPKYRKLTKLYPKGRKRYVCRRVTSINYVDNIIVPFVKKLVDRGVKVIFVSDNGFAIGEYRQWEKNLPYEQVSRTPFIAFNWDIDRNRLTSLIDVATNYYKLFDILPPYPLDGLPYSDKRSTLLVENFKIKLPFTSIVDKNTIKVRYQGGFKQTIKMNKYTDLDNPIKKSGRTSNIMKRKLVDRRAKL